MSTYNANKSRTQIIDLIDESSQPAELSQSDLQLINGGRWCICIYTACSSAMGGGYDYD
jgi:hypothetical protein